MRAMQCSLLALCFVRAEGFPLGKDPFGGVRTTLRSLKPARRIPMESGAGGRYLGSRE